eukprot:gene26948-30466_t
MAGRLFVSRLDEARSPDGRIPEIKNSPINGMAPVDVSRHQMSSKGHHCTPKISLLKYGEKSEIIEKLCEYLFDLFDANCMDDYLRMEKFELRAVESFRDDEAEFTHEQHELHKEFMALFEQLVEGFLEFEGYTVEVFYKELKHFVNKSNQQPNKPKIGTPEYFTSGKVTPADEVMEVINSYMQFEVWAGLMRKQAQQRGAFLTTKDKLHAAAAAVSESAHDGPREGQVAKTLFRGEGKDEEKEEGKEEGKVEHRERSSFK